MKLNKRTLRLIIWPSIFLAFLSIGCRTASHPFKPKVDASTNSYQGAKEAEYQVPFSYISVEALPLKPGIDTRTFRITAKTSLEVFCERSCAKFSLVDKVLDGNISISALKRPELGNSSPSRLNETREFEAKISTIKGLILKDLGKEGNQVAVEDAMSEQFGNFYAAFAEIKAAPSIGGESSGYSIYFDGKIMDASSKDPEFAVRVAASPDKALKGFAIGSIVNKETKQRGPYQEFEVRTFDSSMIEE